MRVEIENTGNIQCKLDGIYSHHDIYRIEIACNAKYPTVIEGSGVSRKGYYVSIHVTNSTFEESNSDIFIYLTDAVWGSYSRVVQKEKYYMTILLYPKTPESWIDITEHKNLNYGKATVD